MIRRRLLDAPDLSDVVLRVGRPYFSESDISAITARIAEVLRSGWLTNGKVVEEFEAEFRSLVGSKYAIAVNSGTAALHTIVASMGLRADEEVVVPANTFISSANAVIYTGAKVALADCDLETFNVTADTLAASVNERTRAVMVTHIAGNPCAMDSITRYCREKGLVLIEDSAHAHGSKYRGKGCGSFGYAGAFSFYPTKSMTSGEGGMITTSGRKLLDFGRLFRNVGRTRLGFGPIVTVGHNYRMSDILAVIGVNQLKNLGRFLRRRNELAKVYEEELGRLPWLQPQKVSRHAYSAYYSYIVRVLPQSPVSRDTLMERLMRKKIETTVMFKPVHQQPGYHRRFLGKRTFPNAAEVGARTIALPLHADMTQEDVSRVAKGIAKVQA